MYRQSVSVRWLWKEEEEGRRQNSPSIRYNFLGFWGSSASHLTICGSIMDLSKWLSSFCIQLWARGCGKSAKLVVYSLQCCFCSLRNSLNRNLFTISRDSPFFCPFCNGESESDDASDHSLITGTVCLGLGHSKAHRYYRKPIVMAFGESSSYSHDSHNLW